MKTASIVVLAHDIRSAHNIGSLFRSCEGFGVEYLYLSGYSPYPEVEKDTRLPHIRERVSREISKTALGAEKMLAFSQLAHPQATIESYRAHGYAIVGLEQDPSAVLLPDYQVPQKIFLILGEEVNGINTEIKKLCDTFLEIPMHGQKESFNVSVAAGIALYALRTQ